MYKRPEYHIIKSCLEELRRFIEVVMGPHQVGKSTVVKQVLEDLGQPFNIFFHIGSLISSFPPCANR